jgi:acetyl-CoA acetyltransferase family protein
MKAVAAQKAGFFDAEIVPGHDPTEEGRRGGREPRRTPARDQLEALAKLKGVVRPGRHGDGRQRQRRERRCLRAAAGRRGDAPRKHGLTPRARVVGMATAGVPPRIMGIGPAPATRKVLELTGLTLAQLDVIELNEAFAAQGLAVLRDLGLADDDARVNPNGGAIALGHPLGASGARLVTTAVNQLHRMNGGRGGRYALCTMCIGVGQGIALILERV